MKKNTLFYIAVTAITAVLSMASCTPKDDNNVLVSTLEPIDITNSSAVCVVEAKIVGDVAVSELGVCWGTSPNPTISNEYVSTIDFKGLKASFSLSGLKPNTNYHVRGFVRVDNKCYYGEDVTFSTSEEGGGWGNGSSGTLSGHNYVDLGLPSGILWATCNIGADSPEGKGYIFAWGETENKTSDNYKFMDEFGQLTKYNHKAFLGYVDMLRELMHEDDAAAQNWGLGWRTPAYVDWEELLNHTWHEWTRINEVQGLLFHASNGNTLFLPVNDSPYPYYMDRRLPCYLSDPVPSDVQRCFNINNLNQSPFVECGREIGVSVRAVHYAGTEVVANSPREVTQTTAVCSGEVLLGQGQEITEIGVCWGTIGVNSYPTVDDLHVSTTNCNSSFELTITDLCPGLKYNARPYIVCNGDCVYGPMCCIATENGVAAIDLGLPSGTLWASCNVGTDTPKETGSMFAWGDVTPHPSNTGGMWSNYKYCNGGYNKLTKYCDNPSYGNEGYTDTLTVLQPSDDAATVFWGEEWKTPTKKECDELATHCRHYFINGLDGNQPGLYAVGPNGNAIFLPYSRSYPFSAYWLSTLDNVSRPDNASHLEVNSGTYYVGIYEERCHYLMVRPVRSSK